MGNSDQHVAAMLFFSGDKAKFAGWKDLFKGHLVALSTALVVNELQDNRQKLVARYEDPLQSECWRRCETG
ncbi:hypothetical protein PC129_g20800 [Phytophthora cactorum]|uniref:Uncharacterized protein n=1 Tax=Phytophthora cactorum TaxID=29920 RepID=A0A329SDR9_9STRA|nr:hypothetical protein PC114_g21617 [Phytophthora cactorum]KAG2891192.1 hypothetical protein PC115_g19281 [Phytophthora cactorum]KAG2962552.1 hypothetical protein PC118_g21366 [Phytophthora cactorum]KAG2971460.1 hypothetical protein PC119_g23391 [Phytophthora cactorum]KAG3000234.1 hypothetical protein PC120_g20767 [Phytophthora cactorum]